MGKSVDLTGMRFGRLLVIEQDGVYQLNGNKKWKVQCECGVTKTVLGSSLKNGSVVSCGCFQREKVLAANSGRSPANMLKAGTAGWNSYFYKYSYGAVKRGLDFSLTKEQFIQIATQDCHYCNAAPEEKAIKNTNGGFYANGIDRIDNNFGYTIENSVPCCGQCNFAKRNMSYEDFLNMIKRIYINRIGG